jgi:hypothetical protein
MCSKKKILAFESRDLSQAEKEITDYKYEQIHKMITTLKKNSGNIIAFMIEAMIHFSKL